MPCTLSVSLVVQNVDSEIQRNYNSHKAVLVEAFGARLWSLRRRRDASSAVRQHVADDRFACVLLAVQHDYHLRPHHRGGRLVLRAGLRSGCRRDLRTHQRGETVETYKAQVWEQRVIPCPCGTRRNSHPSAVCLELGPQPKDGFQVTLHGPPECWQAVAPLYRL